MKKKKYIYSWSSIPVSWLAPLQTSSQRLGKTFRKGKITWQEQSRQVQKGLLVAKPLRQKATKRIRNGNL